MVAIVRDGIHNFYRHNFMANLYFLPHGVKKYKSF